MFSLFRVFQSTLQQQLLRPSKPHLRGSLIPRRSSAAASATPASSSTSSSKSFKRSIWDKIRERPIEYASIPCVAAFVGISTNWLGVKMLFYPIEYLGIDIVRWKQTPYGIFGWQGVVPTKTEPMATRLVNVITQRLLTVEEAFENLDPYELSRLLLPTVQEFIQKESGSYWSLLLQPILPILLPRVLQQLQTEIGSVIDLHTVVLSAFVRDKIVLVELFQKVGRVELEFLVNSGFGFGFGLGILQMIGWAAQPVPWTLVAVGGIVGYVTNWIAIKLLFDPAEPVSIANGFIVIQGLFESRQVEVSDEFGDFMKRRVLTPASLLNDLASGGETGDLFEFLRRQLPYPIPSHILQAAIHAIQHVADHPSQYPELHQYISDQLDIDHTLASRLKVLSSTDFEDLLHPVFQEDEIVLIMTGGVLGLLAGAAQTQLGWGGPGATVKAIATMVITLLASAGFYAHQKYELVTDEPLASTERPHLQRRETIIRVPVIEEWFEEPPTYN